MWEYVYEISKVVEICRFRQHLYRILIAGGMPYNNTIHSSCNPANLHVLTLMKSVYHCALAAGHEVYYHGYRNN